MRQQQRDTAFTCGSAPSAAKSAAVPADAVKIQPKTTAATTANPATAPAAAEPTAGNGNSHERERSPRRNVEVPQEVLTALGLTVRPVAKDGNCFFHMLSFWSRKAGRETVEAKLLRTQLAEFQRHNQETYEPFWVG